ncbi:MAG: TrmH family RNA methyltransferase [Acidimicrobiales bacterium]
MALRSATKSHLSELRTLLGSASARRTHKRFVVEGPVLVAELLASPVEVSHLVGTPDLLEVHADAGVELFDIQPGRLDRVLSTQTPQQIAAVAVMPASSPLPAGGILAQVHMSDPGNVGTMIRTAEAGGMAGVALVGDCVDHWNPKVIRASAGAVFRIPILALGVDEFFSLGRHPVVATTVTGGVDYRSIELDQAVLCLGNEAHGLDSDFIDRCDQAVTIPLAGPTESLNVAAAAAIVVFAALEQRQAITLARSS